MIQAIIKDESFLRLPSLAASADDLSVAQDLIDTLNANEQRCVGLAANMIGVNKRIIAVDNEGATLLMLNPEIIKCSAPYIAQEACLSLEGVRKAKRYTQIKVKYQNENLQTRLKTFKGFTAQIIQHEIDHLSGIII